MAVEKIEPGRTGRRPVDIVVATYLAISGIVLLLPHRPDAAPFLFAAHLLGVLVLLRIPPFRWIPAKAREHWPRLAKLLGDWYPMLLIPLLYKELGLLTPIVWGGHYFDGPILSMEAWLFRSSPSSDLALRFPNLLLSEVLHLSYLSFYLIIFGPPLILYWQGRLENFEKVVLGVMLAFTVHYVFFIFFPVEGPFFRGASYLTGHVRGPVQRFALTLSSAGATKGATFPSSHVGVSVAQATLAFYFLRRLFPLLALGAAGVAVGAVYCGYHYGVDSVAGIVVGWSVAYGVARKTRAS